MVAALTALTGVLTAQSTFLSQLVPEAGLGCHPFHVTAVGRLHMYVDAQVTEAMRTVASATLAMSGRVVRGKMTGTGSVQVIVEAPEMFEASRQLHALLPQGNLYGPELHITIGRLPDLTERERVLALLAARVAALPAFISASIEFETDRADPLPPAVPLVYNSILRSRRVIV